MMMKERQQEAFSRRYIFTGPEFCTSCVLFSVPYVFLEAAREEVRDTGRQFLLRGKQCKEE